MQPEEILKKVAIFEFCSTDELEAVLLYANRRTYSPYTAIARQGEDSQTLFIMIRGSVRVVYHHEDGRELSLAILRPHESFGEMSLIDAEPVSATVETLEETECLLITRESFKRLIEKVPAAALGIMKSITRRLRKCNEELADMAFMSVSGRLAKKLVELQKENSVTLTHKELGSLIGATRENVTRALGAFERQGYVRNSRNQIDILNLEAIKAAGSIVAP